jgi:3-phosphoshikimate 1-carboxyvinyltransferase
MTAFYARRARCQEAVPSAVDRLVTPLDAGNARVTAPVPSGKSELLRALAILAIRGEGTVLATPPFGEDVTGFVAALGALGAQIAPASDRIVVLAPIDRGAGGAASVHVEEGGAPARFLLALAATVRREVTLTGGARLGRRPFQALAAALADLGATVGGGPGLPITVRGPLRGGPLRAELCTETSQFASALLLVAPAMERPLALELSGPIASEPYVELTVRMLRRAGARIERRGAWFRVEPGFGRAGDPLVAPVDWSGAVPMLAAAPLIGRAVHVPGLLLQSDHPDAAFARVAEALGMELAARDGGVVASGRVSRGGAFDLRGAPDLAPHLAVLGALAPEGITITNATHLRVKESDRIADLVAMLNAAGIPSLARPDGIATPGCFADARPADDLALPLDPRGDHRLAMAGALIGLMRPVVVRDAQVVAKSFPGFFEVFPAGGRWRRAGAEPGPARLT